MSRKRKSFTADFKAKCVLELLEGEKTLNEIADEIKKQWLNSNTKQSSIKNSKTY